ncbi:unnamed protein product, partial [Prorocentrum cordatum]
PLWLKRFWLKPFGLQHMGATVVESRFLFSLYWPLLRLWLMTIAFSGRLRVAIPLLGITAFASLRVLTRDGSLDHQPTGLFSFLQSSGCLGGNSTALAHQSEHVSLPECGSTDLLFNVGQGRTGTTTMHHVVEQLGYKSVHGFQTVNLQEVIDFKQHPGSVDSSNVFADLVNQTGTPKLRPFDWSGEWPERGTAFHDVPFFSMPCELYLRYPRAKFFMLDKDEARHAKSVMVMYCDYDCQYDKTTKQCSHGSHCDLFLRGDRAGIQRNELRGFIWGQAYSTFCQNAVSICSVRMGQSPENNLYARTLQLLVFAHREHVARVHSCIPAESLFHTDGMFRNFSRELAKFVAFLGCKPKTAVDSMSLPEQR